MSMMVGSSSSESVSSDDDRVELVSGPPLGRGDGGGGGGAGTFESSDWYAFSGLGIAANAAA